VVFDDYDNYFERTEHDYPPHPEYLQDPEPEPVPEPEPAPEPAPVADVLPPRPGIIPPPREYPVPAEPEPYGPAGPDFDHPAVLHKGAEPDAVYWYHLRTDSWYQLRGEYQLAQLSPTGYMGAAKVVVDPRVPKNFAAAIKDPVWAAAIDKELTKFEVNNCLQVVPDTGQHKVPMMWLFNIKTDGTHKARLVVRGDQMIPYIDFDPNAVYCGNVSACSTKCGRSTGGNAM
jgi:hypothetical protein